MLAGVCLCVCVCVGVSVYTVPFTPKVNTQTHFVFLKCAAARRRAMCEIHMYGQRTFGAVPILPRRAEV